MQFGVLAPQDRILVAVSGGKDSYVLLHLLDKIRSVLPFSIDLVALHVDLGLEGHQPAPLRTWLDEKGLEFEFWYEDLAKKIAKHAAGGQNPCVLCSRLRRGILYTCAQRLGCNKVALGHHRDDALTTLLLNLFFCGRLQAMPARYRTDDGRLELVRPLIEIAERDIARFAQLYGFPIIPCGPCGKRPDHRRNWANDLLTQLEGEHPQLRNVMAAALKNVRPSHLLDPTLLDCNGGKKSDAEHKS
jgi:tRNA 2-thiocytidine biosynthesis protein TtcA